MRKRLERQIKSVHKLDESKKKNILQKLDSITFDFRLCHGDFHPFNLILSKEEKVKVIDWVDASSGDIRADVFRTYLLYSQSSVELAEMYLHIYIAVVPAYQEMKFFNGLLLLLQLDFLKKCHRKMKCI